MVQENDLEWEHCASCDQGPEFVAGVQVGVNARLLLKALETGGARGVN
jgi:hypothetical protein